MKTKALMIGSSIFMLGISLGFLLIPDMLLVLMQTPQTDFIILLMRFGGIFFLSFAVLNWIGKNAFSEGNFNSPVAASNFVHFLAGSVLISLFLLDEPLSTFSVILTSIYVLLAISFALLLFKSLTAARQH